MKEPFDAELDGIRFQLKEAHDFAWLKGLGQVFAVFDQQDSGNLSFGVERSGQRLFVKYAGARPIHYEGEPAGAVARLKAAVQAFEALRHPALVELTDHFEAGAGYAAVFRWFPGDTLHKHWQYPPPAKYTDPASPFRRFRELSLRSKLEALERIFAFHAHVERLGYVAVDFYDGSLLYDFDRGEVCICDIDLYARKPFTNEMGRLWGSSRFMSPEEFQLGAPIDERTNVFNMGATAFVLLGGEKDRSFSLWEAGDALYAVALRAVEEERSKRYATVAEFKAAWEKAVKGAGE